MAFSTNNKPVQYGKKNTFETLGNLGSDFGVSMFDQLFGNASSEKNKQNEQSSPFEKKAPKPQKEIVRVWDFNKEQESRTIKNLMEQIRQEVKMLQQSDRSLMSEVKDIEKITLGSTTEQSGIYTVRFLEVMISILKMLRAKVNESRTWLSTFASKKAKRGSAFMSRKKKLGTQYSMSEELKMGHPGQ